MAERSFWIEIINAFDNLTRKDFGLDGGDWSNNESATPPEAIGVRRRASFGSESNGFATGTAGWATYNSPDGEIKITWSNPFIGNNSFNVSHPGSVQANWGDINGNNAAVAVTLLPNF
jgi:hypothetical protein